jgi:hypothetical protein
MAYIGRDTDKLSNIEVLDAITFDGSSSYTLQKNSVNFTPSSANNVLVSIDGVVQANNFTVSGSTIDFGVAVPGTSTCDWIYHIGVGLITTPADGTITDAKLAASAINSQTAETTVADGDEVLIYDTSATALRKMTVSNLTANVGGGQWEFISQTTLSGSVAQVDFTSLSTDYKDFLISFQNVHFSNDGAKIHIRMFDDGGTIVTSANYGYSYYGGSTSAFQADSNADTAFQVGSTVDATAASSVCCGEVTFYDPHQTTYVKHIMLQVTEKNASGNAQGSNMAGYYNFTTAYTGIRLFPSVGNFDDGKFALFGRKRA